jgi:hypothetical protein
VPRRAEPSLRHGDALPQVTLPDETPPRSAASTQGAARDGSSTTASGGGGGMGHLVGKLAGLAFVLGSIAAASLVAGQVGVWGWEGTHRALAPCTFSCAARALQFPIKSRFAKTD